MQLMQARLPQEKLCNLMQLLCSFSKTRSERLQKWQSLIGHLSFAARVIRPGRPYIRKLIDRIRGVNNSRHFIKVTGEIRRDCSMWLSFLQQYNGISLINPMRDLSYSHRAFATDASDWGFAAVFHNEWFQAQWPADWKQMHISLREFIPVWLALFVWGRNWHHAIVTFHCDNRAVVDVINRFSSRDPGMLEIVQLSLQPDFIVRAQHLPGKLNIVADSLSRLQPDRVFLQLHGLLPLPKVPSQTLLCLIAPYGN